MQLPTPLRAALGLAAEALENARHLPDRAIEVPMLAVSTVLQMSLRAQQRYAMLAARGDEILNRSEPSDDPPPWASFYAETTDAETTDAEPTDTDEPAAAPVQPARSKAGGATRTARPKAAQTKAAQTKSAQTKATQTKAINRPRRGAPSRFDAIGDE